MQSPLAKLLSCQAQLRPDKIAIKHNGNSITYKELDTSSNQVAAYFLANEIGSNDVVAVSMDRSIKLVICLLGIIKAGAGYLPIDPSLPAERIDFILENSNAKILCTSATYAALFRGFSNRHLFEDIWVGRHNFPGDEPKVTYNGNDLAYILYTSGSTGEPKGVAIEQKSLANLLTSIQQSPGVSSDDIMLSITTISFDIAELELLQPIVSGALLVIADNDVVKDGRSLLEIIKKENVSILQATPYSWRMILQSGWTEPLPVKAFCGGETLPRDLANKILGKCSELWNMYGPTETTIYSTIKKISATDELITIGKPIANTQVYILDERYQPVADGQEGEIYIGGEGVARGYVNRPDLTTERFIDDKISGLPGMLYKTGDWAKILNNGEIQYLGRIDHQIKIRGYRIETEEIEMQLKQLRGIKDAVVIMHEDSLGNKQLVGYVVGGQYLTSYQRNKNLDRWKNSLRNKLPDYMIPTTLIPIPHVPVTSNGKLDRDKLPQPISKRTTHGIKLSKNPTEAALMQIILKNTDFGKIGIHDNFIELGIDSMIALMIIVDIEEQLDKRLPLTVLVHHPTVYLLAKFLNTSDSSYYSSLIPLKKQGAKTPLYLLHGIGLNLFNFNSMLSHLDAEQPVYGLRAAGLDGNQKPLKSIESLASYYNEQIFNHDSTGPYAVAGYSFGGIIAFEMVKQMKEAGKQVEMLAMIDTHIKKAQPITFLLKTLRKSTRQFNKLVFRVGSFANYPLANIDYLFKLYTNKAKSLMIWIGILDKYKVSELPGYMQRVVDRLEKAWGKYKIKPYDVKVDLFKAEKRLYYVDEPQLLGWGKYALQGVTIHNVPGDHEDMFAPPNDKKLAEVLQRRLNEMPSNANRDRTLNSSLSA